MKRVAIVGCPGAGKTTFAVKLSEAIHLPIIHLDYYYHQKKYDYPNNREAWGKKVTELLSAQPEWISDGNYSSTFKERFDRADTIIFLDYPRRLILYRNAKRRWTYRNKLRHEMPSEWKEKADWNFIKYVWRFNGAARDKLLEAIAEQRNTDVVILKNPDEAVSYLEQLTK